MIVRVWQEGDTENLSLQPAQGYMRGVLEGVDIKPLAVAKLAWVAEVDGEILAIAGVVPQWENRATAWALIGGNAGKYFKGIHRAVNKFLQECPFRRVEATVDVGFDEGHRWIKMLGFEPEGYLRAYRPDGGDQVMYARIRR